VSFTRFVLSIRDNLARDRPSGPQHTTQHATTLDRGRTLPDLTNSSASTDRATATLHGPNGEALPPPQELAPATSIGSTGTNGAGAIYRLRTPMTSTALPWIMPYAFLGPDGVTLFDAGYGTPEATEALTQQLAAIGRTPADIQRLIISHAHPDHIGMAGWVKRQSPDAQLVMQRIEGEDYGHMDHAHDRWEQQMRTWGVRHGFNPDAAESDQRPDWAKEMERRREAEAEAKGKTTDAAAETERQSWRMDRVAPDILLEDGEDFAFDSFVLRAVWTPGHTAGHLCAYEPNHRFTLTGDHVLSRITPNVSVHADDEENGRNPLKEFLASLEKTAALDTALALPAHEELIPDLPARCRTIIQHHAHRMDEVLGGIGKPSQPETTATALEIASRVTWNRPWATFSTFKQRSAMGETLAHLHLLEEDHRVRRIETGEGDTAVIRWQRTG